MLNRIITGIVLAISFVVVLFLREISIYFFDGLVFLILIVSIYELSNLFKKLGIKVFLLPLLIYIVNLAVFWYVFGVEGYAFAVMICAILCLVMFTFNSKATLIELVSTLFLSIYPSVLLLFFLVINLNIGLMGILMVVMVAFGTDICAYIVGMSLGGKKLCPTISPKKTIAGGIGGLAGGILGALSIFFAFEYFGILPNDGFLLAKGYSMWQAIIIYASFGFGGAFLDTLGDLVASRIKRVAGIKDYGNCLPGHGGAMDRIDGFLFVLPLVAVFFSIL